jgi:patatin-like phospholipase/acyl hydrolase
MAEKSTYPLRLPKSLKNRVALLAGKDGTSINQFIAIAVAEKISALETERVFSQRADQADLEDFKKILFRPGGQKPRPGDEIE